MHTLDGHQKVASPKNGPPLLAQGINPRKALQPFGTAHCWTITAKADGLDLEAQQTQPVAHAPNTDELPHIGQIQGFLCPALAQPYTHLPQAPQAQRVEPGNHHPALGHQHTLHFTQRHVRIHAQFQGVGQHHQIQTGIGKRQSLGLSPQGRRTRRMGRASVRGLFSAREHGIRTQRQPLVRHTVGSQTFDARHTQLQRVVAKDVGHGVVHAGLLPGKQVAAWGRVEPLVQIYNFRAHETAAATRLHRQLHLDAA